METKFKVGDRVFDIALQKWGKVVHTHPGIKYPVRVILDNGKSRFYTAKGYFNESYRIPRLYHQEMVIVPKDSLQRVVQVRNSENEEWKPRVLIQAFPDGAALCFSYAKSVDEAKRAHLTDRWRYWRELPTEPEKIKLTRAEIAEKLGIDIDQFEITD